MAHKAFDEYDITFAAQRGDKPIVNAILVTEWPMGYVVE